MEFQGGRETAASPSRRCVMRVGGHSGRAASARTLYDTGAPSRRHPPGAASSSPTVMTPPQPFIRLKTAAQTVSSSLACSRAHLRASMRRLRLPTNSAPRSPSRGRVPSRPSALPQQARAPSSSTALGQSNQRGTAFIMRSGARLEAPSNSISQQAPSGRRRMQFSGERQNVRAFREGLLSTRTEIFTSLMTMESSLRTLARARQSGTFRFRGVRI